MCHLRERGKKPNRNVKIAILDCFSQNSIEKINLSVKNAYFWKCHDCKLSASITARAPCFLISMENSMVEFPRFISTQASYS